MKELGWKRELSHGVQRDSGLIMEGRETHHGVQRGSGLITEGPGMSTLPIENDCSHSSIFIFILSFFPLLFLLFLFCILSVSLSWPFFWVRGTGCCFFTPSRIDVPALCAGVHARTKGLIVIVGVKSGRNAESDESQSNLHPWVG